MVDEFDFDQLIGSFSDEKYRSSKYTHSYSNRQSTSDSEIEDSISQKESHSPIINGDEHLVADQMIKTSMLTELKNKWSITKSW